MKCKGTGMPGVKCKGTGMPGVKCKAIRIYFYLLYSVALLYLSIPKVI